MALDDIAKVTITASSPGPTRKGFGVPCFVGYHDRWGASSDRVRSYTGLLGMSADGFQSYDPLYKMAAAAFAQRPRPERIKIGRRSAAPNAQVVELTPEAPSAGKIYAAHANGADATYTALVGDDTAAVCTAFASALNAINGADVDAIIATGGASTNGTQNLTGTSLNGVIGTRTMAPARALTFTFSSHADWDATTIVVTGTDGKGTVITESFNVPNGGNATVSGSKLFRTVTAVAIPAQSGSGGTFTMGVRARFTATGASTTKVVCTAVIAGEQIDYSAWSGTLSVAETTADSDLDAQLTAIQTADKAFYGLAIEGQGKAEIEIAAAWAETHGVLFVGQNGATAAMDPNATTDVFSELKALSYGRTLTCFHPSFGQTWMAAALLGNRLPKDPGSDTWVFKTLVGVTSYALTDTQESALKAKRATYYTNISGLDLTSGGLVAGGEWVDVVRGIDWMTARMQERVVALQAQSEKVTFDDAGITAVTGEVIAQIKDGIKVKLLTSSPAYAVSAPKAADVSDADKRLRKLPGVQFTAPLAGAIVLTEISGTLTV